MLRRTDPREVAVEKVIGDPDRRSTPKHTTGRHKFTYGDNIAAVRPPAARPANTGWLETDAAAPTAGVSPPTCPAVRRGGSLAAGAPVPGDPVRRRQSSTPLRSSLPRPHAPPSRPSVATVETGPTPLPQTPSVISHRIPIRPSHKRHTVRAATLYRRPARPRRHARRRKSVDAGRVRSYRYPPRRPEFYPCPARHPRPVAPDSRDNRSFTTRYPVTEP